jgi:hypothetical protein
LEYNHGFRNPKGDLPEAIKASFTREMTELMSGHEADVPEIELSVPFHQNAK